MEHQADPDGARQASHRHANVRPAGIPWLDGALLQYLMSGSVLDVKLPGTRETAPVLPSATVAIADTHGMKLDLPPMELGGARQFDAVFSRDALAGTDDPCSMLAAWFGLVRTDGHLVVVVTQAGRPADAPGLPVQAAEPVWSDAPPGTVCYPGTLDDLADLARQALPADGFRLVHLGQVPGRSPQPRSAELTVELRMVLRKLKQASPPAVSLACEPMIAAGVVEATIPFALVGPGAVQAPGMRAAGDLLVRDFGPLTAPVSRILVLKLDHHGDFIIGLPALRELREAFPTAFIRLVCGRWNVASAQACGLVDDVRCFDFFTERAVDWTGTPASPDWTGFAEATAGRFDLALDLRVDPDTRALLGRVDAALRCGIGSQAQFPLLDIALPDPARDMAGPAAYPGAPLSVGQTGSLTLGPDAFQSDMDVRTPSFHESGFVAGGWCWLRSQPVRLPLGRYRAIFDISAPGFIPGPRGVGVYIEVVEDGGRKVASNVFGRFNIRGLTPERATLAFDSTGDGTGHVLQVRTLGRPLAGRLRFSAVHLHWLDVRGGRFRPSDLHVGEKLSLLVSLIRQRLGSEAPATDDAGAAADRPRAAPMQIVVAPFSNSTIRDWPAAHYARLIDRLVVRLPCHVRLVGAPAQAAQAAALMAMLAGTDAQGRVRDDVGKTRWADLPAILGGADLVICNNSGIAHQAAHLGAPTLAIYSASHQPTEWGSRGPRARAIMLSVSCSPCGYERLEDCSHGHVCMQMITPNMVLEQAERMLGIDLS